MKFNMISTLVKHSLCAFDQRCFRYERLSIAAAGADGIDVCGSPGGARASEEAEYDAAGDGCEDELRGEIEEGGCLDHHIGEIVADADVGDLYREHGEQNAEDCADKPDKCAFEEDHLCNMCACGAEGAEDSEFLASFGDHHEESLCDIDGGNRDDEETDQREEQREYGDHEPDTVCLGVRFIEFEAEFADAFGNFGDGAVGMRFEHDGVIGSALFFAAEIGVEASDV